MRNSSDPDCRNTAETTAAVNARRLRDNQGEAVSPRKRCARARNSRLGVTTSRPSVSIMTRCVQTKTASSGE
ncbi:hypothetical protein D3C73_1310420 [compost metagenome]